MCCLLVDTDRGEACGQSHQYSIIMTNTRTLQLFTISEVAGWYKKSNNIKMSQALGSRCSTRTWSGTITHMTETFLYSSCFRLQMLCKKIGQSLTSTIYYLDLFRVSSSYMHYRAEQTTDLYSSNSARRLKFGRLLPNFFSLSELRMITYDMVITSRGKEF